LFGAGGEGAEVDEYDRHLALDLVAELDHRRVAGAHQLEQALRHEAREGLGQRDLTVVQAVVVERHRGVLTKQLDQLPVPGGELAEALHEHGGPHLLVAEDAEDVVGRAQHRGARAQHGGDVAPDLVLDDVADELADVAVEAAGAGDDGGRGRDEVEAEAMALEEHRALLGADERGELVEDAGDEVVDRLALEQGGGGADDLLEAELVGLDGAQVAIRAHGADDGGGQALGCDLGLVAVVVDVVVEHHPLLGGRGRAGRCAGRCGRASCRARRGSTARARGRRSPTP
jgi:hypothetical protein